jgi:hypothetical protein
VSGGGRSGKARPVSPGALSETKVSITDMLADIKNGVYDRRLARIV